MDTLLQSIGQCQLCADDLPHAPRPVVRLGKAARVVIIGQAPGAKVHASGVPWDDDSGDHLLEWLGVDRPTFEDPDRFAIIPMGFCWPGRKKGGDLPPRPICAPTWHPSLLSHLPEDRLVILTGLYAQRHYLGGDAKRTLTETVRTFQSYLPGFLPLPHPAWRSKLWMAKNPWFEAEVLPVLRREVARRI
ncbi:MAG: uracil-DNA glycosylase [Myxococcota bacterium]|jgi:uracil-DNA glycosylase